MISPRPKMVMPPLRIALCVALGAAWTTPVDADAEPAATETIVLVRHGEKPALGLGQLDCQGLNRALALPAVIAEQFGTPNAILAPDPAQQKEDHGHPYDYVRPLATIEPTAIAYGLPVDSSIGVSDIDALQRKLEAPVYRNALVVVAWEHVELAKLAGRLVADHGGDPAIVPDWRWDDFDSIYVIRLRQTAAGTVAAFEHRHEGLDGQPTACPGKAPEPPK